MAQKLLHRPQVRAVIQKMRGKAVAKTVGRQAVLCTNLVAVFMHDVPHGPVCKRASPQVEKQRLAAGAFALLRDAAQIVAQRLHRVAAQIGQDVYKRQTL